MKKILLFCALTFLFNSIKAQNLSFHKLYCTTQDDYAINNFLPLPSGSVFTVGADTLNYAANLTTAVIGKFDKDFNLIWKKKYGGTGSENFNFIEYLGDNRLLIRGSTNSQDGDVMNNYPTGFNQWVCITDTNGNILHQTIYGGDAAVESNEIKVGTNGDIYFCGSADGNLYDFTGNGPFDFQADGYIACADSHLNKKWIRWFEVINGHSEVRDVEFLPNGNLILVCNSNVKDGALAVDTPNDRGGAVIMEMDTSGNVKWQKRYGAADPGVLDGLLAKIYRNPSNNHYYITGATSSKTGDCWDTYPYLALGDHNYQWVLALDTLGNKVWSHIFGGFSIDATDDYQCESAELLDNNNLHFAAYIKGSDAYAYGPAIGKWDSWLIYIDSNGTMYKHNRVGYSNVEWVPRQVRKNPVTNEMYYLYWDGKFTNYVPSPNVCDSAFNNRNFLIGKYNFWADGVEEQTSNEHFFKVYPNPARNEINIEPLEKGTLVSIFDMNGKLVKKFRATKSRETIAVDTWVKGTYVLSAEYKGYKSSQKIIIQ